MKRDVDINEITDGKRYQSSELCKLGCKGCSGCSDCCKDRGSVITLDPYDLYALSKALKMTFDELLSAGKIQLAMIDGLALPALSTVQQGNEEKCVFLNDAGLCDIHSARPGICRLFPLGRLYDENGFSYLLQVNECSQSDGMKVKISKWLDIPNLKTYEKYILSYHTVLTSVREVLDGKDADFRQRVNMGFLNAFFRNPYDLEVDFYDQFEMRKNELFS